MNRFFGFSRNAVALVGIVVAIILVVLVGMIVIGSAALRALMAPGLKVEGVSLLALLVTIIVLLSAVLIVLLALFWCCCRQQGTAGKEGAMPPDVLAVLLPMLPLLQRLPNLLRDVAVAIYEAGKALGWIQQNLATAARDLTTAANTTLANAPKIKVPPMEPVPGGLWLLPTNPFNVQEVNPLDGLLATLRQVSASLAPTGGGPVMLNNAIVPVATVSTTLVDLGKELAKLANALHANPAPPPELLP